MKEEILFIGLDVDDKAYHAHGRYEDSTEEVEFRCRPLVGTLIEKLRQVSKEGIQIKLCYEATYLGFSLYRDLRKAGFECEVIAPSLIPQKPGDKVKTDKLDSRKLSEYFKNNQLTIVRVPKPEQESVRDLIRSRVFFKDQAKRVKLHVLAMCRRLGWQYREPGATTSYWTFKHVSWLGGQANQITDRALKFNMVQLIEQVKLLEAKVQSYDAEIEGLSKTPEYKTKVEALSCYRGIDIFTAMMISTEIWDANRFNHPKRLTSYAGMDLIEESSGGKEKKYRITKNGNRYLRTAVVEACQTALQPPRVCRNLKLRRKNIDKKYIDIADRCMKRLHKKSTRMLYGGKMKNKIKVACARELLCFVWESLRLAA